MSTELAVESVRLICDSAADIEEILLLNRDSPDKEEILAAALLDLLEECDNIISRSAQVPREELCAQIARALTETDR